MCGAETWIVGKVGQKYLENVVLEKDSWTDHVKYAEVRVLCRAKKERNTLHTTKIRKANWIGHIFTGTAF